MEHDLRPGHPAGGRRALGLLPRSLTSTKQGHLKGGRWKEVPSSEGDTTPSPPTAKVRGLRLQKLHLKIFSGEQA